VRAVIEVRFPSPELARAVLKALETKGERARVDAGVEKNVVRIKITATDFPALRARTTSALRDLKILYDAINMKERRGGLSA